MDTVEIDNDGLAFRGSRQGAHSLQGGGSAPPLQQQVDAQRVGLQLYALGAGAPEFDECMIAARIEPAGQLRWSETERV
jgi:hypothetical protein